MLAQRKLVSNLLRHCPADLRTNLLSVYSDISSSVGYYFFDLNDFARAWDFRQQARTAAHDADNARLEMHAFCEMSYTTSSQGDASAAINTVEAARNLASRVDDPLMEVCVAAKTARAYAVAGQHHRCRTELEKAQDRLKSAEYSAPTSPAYFYNEGFLLSEESDCLLLLGKPREAAATARAALPLLDERFAGSRAYCMLRLGNSYLRSGDLDEAVRVVDDVAPLAARIRTPRLMKELHAMRSRMQPWRHSPTVKTLDDKLAAHGLVTTSLN